MFEKQRDMLVIAQTENGRSLVHLAGELKPNVEVMGSLFPVPKMKGRELR